MPLRKAPAFRPKGKTARNSFKHGAKKTRQERIAMNQLDIDNFIRKIETIANQHWANVAGIARMSQEAERLYLGAGETVQAHRKYDVVGSYYKSQAEEAMSSAYDRMTTEHDRLLQKARVEESAIASADQLASIEAFFKTNPSADSITSYYERNGANYTCAKLILAEAAKKHMVLPEPPAKRVLDSFEHVEKTLYRLAHGVGGAPYSVYILQLKLDFEGGSGFPSGSWRVGEE